MDNNYLKKAKRYFKFAEKELQEAALKKDNVRAQQAAEKGYFCLLRIVDALLFKKGVKEENFPKNEHHRLYYLRKYTDKEFRRKYEAIRHSLHINAFHNEIINFEHLKERFDDLKELLDKVA